MDTSGPGVRVPDSGTLGSVVDTLDRVRDASVNLPIRPPGLLLELSELSLPFPMLIQICSLPPSSRCPQGPPVLGHLGPPARLLWATPCPPVLAPHLSPFRTPVPLCVSLLGATLQLSTKESRGSFLDQPCLGPLGHQTPAPTHNSNELSLFSFYIAEAHYLSLYQLAPIL